jgi:hypothetical protein
MNGVFANYLWTTVLGKRILNILNHVIFPSKIQIYMYPCLWLICICYLDVNWKYQPTEPEYEVCWRVSEANESQASYSVEQADIFQNQSYSHSDDIFIILRSTINTDTYIFVFSREKLNRKTVKLKKKAFFLPSLVLICNVYFLLWNSWFRACQFLSFLWITGLSDMVIQV